MYDQIQIINRQVDILSGFIGSVVPHGQKYALLDFPAHSNVGDSAIWLGEIVLLERIMACAPAYVCDYGSLDAERCRAAIGNGPIFLHGGGNFGDIYPNHQNFRLHVLKRFPNNPVIQLPQSIAFGTNAGLNETVEAINSHGQNYLLTRDQPSLEFARKHFKCEAYLMPDSAFCLGAIARPAAAQASIAMLMRTDEERVAFGREPFANLPDAILTDWLDEPADTVSRTRRQATVRAVLTGSFAPNQRRLIRYNLVAGARVKRGLNTLAKGAVIITDRLHAHILSLLLNIPHVLLDNSYGKIGRYVDAWTSTYPDMRRAQSPDEAVLLAKELLECSAV